MNENRRFNQFRQCNISHPAPFVVLTTTQSEKPEQIVFFISGIR